MRKPYIYIIGASMLLAPTSMWAQASRKIGRIYRIFLTYLAALARIGYKQTSRRRTTQNSKPRAQNSKLYT